MASRASFTIYVATCLEEAYSPGNGIGDSKLGFTCVGQAGGIFIAHLFTRCAPLCLKSRPSPEMETQNSFLLVKHNQAGRVELYGETQREQQVVNGGNGGSWIPRSPA